MIKKIASFFVLMLMLCVYAHAEISVQIAETKGNHPAMVTIVSDDGVFETGLVLNDLAKKYDLPITVAGYVRRVKSRIPEWVDILEEGNLELISHSWNHTKMSDETAVSDDEYYQEIYDAKLFYETGFNKFQIAFVCPNNEMTLRGYEFLKAAGYYAVRRGTRGENSLNPQESTEPFGWYNLGIRGIGDVEDTQSRNAWIDSAIKNRTWLIEMWHDVSPEGGTRYQEITTQMAADHLAYIAWQEKQGNIWVASLQEATRYLREKQNASVEAVIIDDEITINLTCDRDKLPIELFSDPLTLLIDVPDHWKYVFAFQNGGALQVEWDEATGSVMIDAIPDGGEIVLNTVY